MHVFTSTPWPPSVLNIGIAARCVSKLLFVYDHFQKGSEHVLDVRFAEDQGSEHFFYVTHEKAASQKDRSF